MRGSVRENQQEDDKNWWVLYRTVQSRVSICSTCSWTRVTASLSIAPDRSSTSPLPHSYIFTSASVNCSDKSEPPRLTQRQQVNQCHCRLIWSLFTCGWVYWAIICYSQVSVPRREHRSHVEKMVEVRERLPQEEWYSCCIHCYSFSFRNNANQVKVSPTSFM